MSTFDQMIIDDRDLANRYFGENNYDDLDDDQYLFSKPLTNNRQEFNSKSTTQQSLMNKNTNDNDSMGLFGRRVFLESPGLGNKEDEDIYRYVPSRLSDHQASVPASSGETLIDSLDFELDLIGATNTRHTLPYRTQLLQETKPPAPLTQLTNPLTPMTNMRKADPRQDPLLGPLLAELDAMTTQQQRLVQPLPPAVSDYRRNSVPYEPNLMRPSGLSQANHTLTTTANRTVNDALLEAELYDSLDQRDQQIPPIQQRQSIPLSAPNLNSSNHPQQHHHHHQQQQQQQPQHRQQQQQQHHQQPQPQHQLPNRRSNMNSTDIFMPSSYDTGPTSFLSNFGAEDQLFQQPLLNAIGQNYVPNPRAPVPPPPRQQHPPPPQQQFDQRDTTFDNSYARMSPPQRPPQQQQQPPPPPPSNRQYDNENDPFSEYHEMYAPSQYQRLPPSQQQRTTQSQPPHPPASQQQRYQRPPQPSQHQQQQYYEEQSSRSNHPPNNQEMFFTDHNDDQLESFSYQQPPTQSINNQRHVDQQNDQDSRRQAVWNELQRTNAKVQEKNAKKRESANRREQLLKGTYSSNNAWNGSQQSSAQSKTGGPTQRRPPPVPPIPKTNYIEENIDMIKNKENSYHRYPAKKYENLYSKRKGLAGEGNNDQNQDTRMDYDQTQSQTSMNNPVVTYSDLQQRSSLPVTINLNPENTSQGGNLPNSLTIPLDSQIIREGDKISVNIDLRLADLQNLKQQQQTDRPDWSGLDPLDRHIRKLERSIDQSLPQTHSPTERTPTFSNPNINTSMGRYGKTTTGAGRSGTYSPPNYNHEYYNYGDKGQEENSYLAKMNHTKKGPHFKPYNGRDYEQFKKNYGFGTGYLGFDFDNPNYKEKTDKLIKTKEYAQQIEARNKKILAEAPRRTLSDTRIPTESSKTQRALEYARVSTRHKPASGASTHSTPPDMNGGIPPRRPTEVLHRPPPVQKQSTKFPHNDDNELVERLAMRHERDKAQVQGILNPSQKRREPLFDDDDRRGVSDIERLAQDRANQRRFSPPKQLPPSGSTNTGNGRRPLRFDKPLVPDEPTYPPSQQQQYRPVQQTPSNRQQSAHQRHTTQHHEEHHQTNVEELANRHTDEKMLMEAIRQELSERPLGDDEELIVVEQ